jgi:hypothetical protein
MAASFLYIRILLLTHMRVNPEPPKGGIAREKDRGTGRVAGSRLRTTIGSWVEVSVGGVELQWASRPKKQDDQCRAVGCAFERRWPVVRREAMPICFVVKGA